MNKFFGTDGIRGIANKGVMTPEVALKLGSAAGTIFTRGDHRHLAVIGKDTRLSGYLLEPALVSGLIAVGMDVLLVGPLPTPAISILTKSLRADIGIMISASHNSFEYNGIKIFDNQGVKLDKKVEAQIERLILNYPKNITFASSDRLGKARRLDDASGRYIEFAKNTFPKFAELSELKIVIDSANGAAYSVAQKIFWELGAEVIDISNKPDGFNINRNCGSTYPSAVQKATLEHKADIGIAFDGDADRVILVDEKGGIIDGDKILATIAMNMKEKKELNSDVVVATHMSNIALERYLESQSIELLRTDVGDKNVAKLMLNNNYNLGGEQSGHIILPEFSATGDGIIAALQVLKSFVESDSKTISELCHKYQSVPQKLENIDYRTGNMGAVNDEALEEKTKYFSTMLDKNSRLLIRKSGTEPLIRVMLESHDQTIMKEIVSAIKREIINV